MKKQNGGNHHAIDVYGNMNQQTSQTGQGNLINSNRVGGSLTNLAVPAVLLYANNAFGKKIKLGGSRKRKSRKSRKHKKRKSKSVKCRY
jgi:large exoprotein involved in heme utilization and adhesion